MGFFVATNLDTIDADIDATLKTLMSPIEVTLGSIPEPEDLPVTVNGWFSPYIVYQIGDTRQQGSRSFIGPIGDSYALAVYVQIVAPNDGSGGQLRNKLVTGFTGKNFVWAGSTTKSTAGAVFSMRKADGSTKASIMPCSFVIPGVQLV